MTAPRSAFVVYVNPQPERVACVVLCLLLGHLLLGEAMNLDARQAVKLHGPPNSNFGYSVALWRRAPSKYSPLVVGSPRWAGPEGPEGGIFFCDPTNGSCRAGPALLAGPDTRVLEEVSDEYRSERGLGEHLQTVPAAEHLLVCAPRYPLEQTIRRIQGIMSRGACALLGPDAVEDIIPVTELNFYIIRPDGTSENHPNSIRFTGFGVSGFSSVMQQDGKQMFIGAPMAYFGQGTLFRKTLGNPTVSESRQDRNVNYDFMTEYWAMAIARLDGNADILAASAPGADDLRGAVFLYSIGRRLVPRSPRTGAPLKGTEVGAMYGYSLAAGDWDGDGVADLAVGAPYSAAQQLGATRGAADAGAVHVIYGPLSKSVERANQLLSKDTEDAHFGLVLLCPGDLNLDSYADLVVGAPDDGHGKVFIYNGSPEGLETQPSQVLEGENFLTPGTRGGRFGFSLSGGHDIDNNGCPDLLVGAVEASQAVFLRSAPVLTLVGEMSLHPSVVVLGQTTCKVKSRTGAPADEYTCFDLHIDLRYNSTVFNESIETELYATVDERYPFVRTVFLDTHNKSRTLSRKISHVSEDTDPITLKVYIKSERPSLTELVQATLKVRLRPSPSLLPPVIIPPILKDTELRAATRLACNDVHQCYSSSDLQLTIQQFPLVIGGERSRVTVSVRVLGARAHQVALLVHLPSLLSFSHASSNHLLPHCDYLPASSPSDAFTKLSCSIANTLSKNSQMEFTLYLEHSPLTLLQALQQDPYLTLPVGFNISSDTQDLNPRDNTASISLEPLVQRDVLLKGFSQTEQVRALLNDTLQLADLLRIRPDNNSMDVAALGPIVSHSYTLRNRGPTPLLGDELVVSWPLSFAMGGGQHIPVLYLTHNVTVSGPMICEQPPVNTLNFTLLAPQESPSPRDLNGQDGIVMDYYNATDDSDSDADESPRVKRSPPVSDSDNPTSVPAIDCDLIPCYSIRCVVSTLSAREEATVVLHSRLVVAAVHDKHRNMVVSSRASLTSTGTAAAVDSYVTLIAPPRGTLGLLSGQWWLLSIALLVGLLVLLLLAIALYKCGFFRRDKRQHLQQLRASQRNRHQPPERQLSKAEEQEQQQLYVQEQLARQQQPNEDDLKEDLENQEPLLFDQGPPPNQLSHLEQLALQNSTVDQDPPQRYLNA